MKTEIEINQITINECKDFILKKHYAKRKPRIQYVYGIFINNILEGIVTYGYPATPFVSRGICGKEYEKEVLELNRLVVNENVPKNTTSYLVAKSLKLLPEKYKIIISYADTDFGHIGYIYQATNWIYVGLTIDMKEWRKKDSNLHSQNVCKGTDLEKRKKDKNYVQIYRPKKHRYLYFRGTKKEKKERLSKLKYEIEKYPKGKTNRFYYDLKEIKQSNLCVVGIKRDAPCFQQGGVGAIPTQRTCDYLGEKK